MASNLFDFENCSIVIENDIMDCSYKPIDEIGLEIAKVCINQRIDVSSGKSYPCIFDLTKVKNVTKEARDYLAKEGNELVKASALLINSPVTKMIGNFFIAVNKPANPTRIFTDKDEALKWLEQFK